MTEEVRKMCLWRTLSCFRLEQTVKLILRQSHLQYKTDNKSFCLGNRIPCEQRKWPLIYNGDDDSPLEVCHPTQLRFPWKSISFLCRKLPRFSGLQKFVFHAGPVKLSLILLKYRPILLAHRQSFLTVVIGNSLEPKFVLYTSPDTGFRISPDCFQLIITSPTVLRLTVQANFDSFRSSIVILNRQFQFASEHFCHTDSSVGYLFMD